MGLILDLLPISSGLWSYTTENSVTGLYLYPDYPARPLDWTIDWGLLAPESDAPLVETLSSYASAHPLRHRYEQLTGSYNSVDYHTLDGVSICTPYIRYQYYTNLDTVAPVITGVATLDTRGQLAFSEISFSLMFGRDNVTTTYSILIDWGDETSTTDTPPAFPAWNDKGDLGDIGDYTYNHAYDAPGLYTITFTATLLTTPETPEDNIAIYPIIRPIPADSFLYGATIDWGDDSQDTYSETSDGTGLDTLIEAGHTYTSPGAHTVTIISTQGTWSPELIDDQVIALGPMACGFRFGIDMTYAFRYLGFGGSVAPTISSGLRLSNVLFLFQPFVDSVNVTSLPPLQLNSLRDFYQVLYPTSASIPVATLTSFYRCSLYKNSYHTAYEENLLQFGIYSSIDPNNDPLDPFLIKADNGDCSDISLDYSGWSGTVNTVSGATALYSLLDKNWTFYEIFLRVGFFLDSTLFTGATNTTDTGFLVPIQRIPGLNPEDPGAASVTVQTTLESYQGSFSALSIRSDTVAFTEGETLKNAVITLTSGELALLQEDFSNANYASLKFIITGVTNELPMLPGSIGATYAASYNLYWGMYIDPASITTTPTTGGWIISVTVGRRPALNPASPGTATVTLQTRSYDPGTEYNTHVAHTDPLTFTAATRSLVTTFTLLTADLPAPSPSLTFELVSLVNETTNAYVKTTDVTLP